MLKCHRGRIRHSRVGVCAKPELVDAVAPLSVTLRLARRFITAFTVLAPIAPFASVAAAVRPNEFSIAHLHVVAVFTEVATPIRPGEAALALHAVGAPLALVASSIGPGVDASPVQIVVKVFAYVSAAVGPREAADAVLPTHDEAALVLTAVRPGLDSEPVLAVFTPFADVLGAVEVLEGATTLRHVVRPVALVALTGLMYESSVAMHLVGFPLSFILATVPPDLHAAALSLAVDVPAADIEAAIVKLDRALFDEYVRAVLTDFLRSINEVA